MTLHASDAAVTAQAKNLAKKKSRKYVALGAAAVLLTTTGGAWAAMTIFGEGSVSAEAYQAKGLTVTDTKLSKKLHPGAEADIIMKVTNPNPFPVKVTQIARTGNPTDVSAGCDMSKVSSPVTQTPAAYDIPADEQVTVGAEGEATVKVLKVVKLDLSATAGCGFTVGIKITGVQSAG